MPTDKITLNFFVVLLEGAIFVAKGKSITNASNYTLISGSAGNDIIKSNGYNVTINGGAGNDKITVKGSYNEVSGGKGNDTIYGDSLNSDYYGINYQYANGDGNDIIYGYKDNDTVSITGAGYSQETVGKNVVLTMYNSSVANGKITLVGAKGKNINVAGYLQSDVLTLTADDDYFFNRFSTVVSGLAGDDTIENSVSSAEIYGDAGNDYLQSERGGVTIYGGIGNDTIYSAGSNDVICGEAGKDFIYSAGYNGVTIDGGTDNDTILSTV